MFLHFPTPDATDERGYLYLSGTWGKITGELLPFYRRPTSPLASTLAANFLPGVGARIGVHLPRTEARILSRVELSWRKEATITEYVLQE